MHNSIQVRRDDSEIFAYDYPDFPARAQACRISSYPRYRAATHWHEDIELIFIQEGEMIYEVNGEAMPLRAGEGICVNSRQLHSMYAVDKTECVYLCALLHPRLLAATDTIALRYVSEHLNHSGMPYCVLKSTCAWQKEILEQIQRIYELRVSGQSPLRIQARFLEIWVTLTENVRLPSQTTKKEAEKLDVLKAILRFLYAHYAEHITLKQIAQAGNVGKSTCTELFKSHLHKTPVNYLIQYRLEKAAELLLTSNLSVTEIAYSVGFTSPSYFTSAFRESYHCSPTRFRHQDKQE